MAWRFFFVTVWPQNSQGSNTAPVTHCSQRWLARGVLVFHSMCNLVMQLDVTPIREPLPAKATVLCQLLLEIGLRSLSKSRAVQLVSAQLVTPRFVRAPPR